MIQQPLALAATIASITALAFWLDRRFAWATRVGATLLVIVFGALISNLGLVPFSSPVYDTITGPVTSLAIVWLLLAVDLRDLRAAGPRMLAAFGIAVAATCIGALTASLVFADTFGDDAWKLAGVLTGTYAGGSLNFVAVGRAVELPTTLFAAATAADNVATAIWIGATLMLPVWLARFYPTPPPAGAPGRARDLAPDGVAGGSAVASAAQAADAVGVAAGGRTGESAVTGAAREPIPAGSAVYAEAAGTQHDAIARTAAAPDRSTPTHAAAGGAPAAPEYRDAPPEHPFFAPVPLRLLDLTVLLALGLLLLRAAAALGAAVPAVPAVLWLTTLALALGQLPHVRRLAGALQLGSLALHFFFAVIGILSRVSEIARVGPEVFYLTALVVLIHGVVTFGAARAARLDVGTTAVASQAAVGGPSTALALAVARDWRALVLPGTVAGLLGYAVGNYAGLGVAYLVRSLLGG